MQWLFPVIIMVAMYLFLRGHDLPGGGFAAGVTMSIALILHTWRAEPAGSRRGCGSFPSAGWASACSAPPSPAWEPGLRPSFLTSHFQYLDLPVIGDVPAATALLFDLGVFAVVVGATVLILIALAHQSVRSPRPGAAADPRRGACR